MMRFVPIPTPKQNENYQQTALYRTRQYWMPLLPRIAQRSKEPIEAMKREIESGRAHIAVAFDDEKNTARALIGIQFRQHGPDLVAEVIWLGGFGSKEWQHLLQQVEQ